MPCYDFSNPNDDSDIRSVFQGINDIHELIVDGIKWDRIFSVPQIAAQGLKVDCRSEKQFMDRTAKGGTMGELWDRAGELSQMRVEKYGGDEFKEASEAKKKKSDAAKKAANKANRRKLKGQ